MATPVSANTLNSHLKPLQDAGVIRIVETRKIRGKLRQVLVRLYDNELGTAHRQDREIRTRDRRLIHSGAIIHTPARKVRYTLGSLQNPEGPNRCTTSTARRRSHDARRHWHDRSQRSADARPADRQPLRMACDIHDADERATAEPWVLHLMHGRTLVLDALVRALSEDPERPAMPDHGWHGSCEAANFTAIVSLARHEVEIARFAALTAPLDARADLSQGRESGDAAADAARALPDATRRPAHRGKRGALGRAASDQRIAHRRRRWRAWVVLSSMPASRSRASRRRSPSAPDGRSVGKNTCITGFPSGPCITSQGLCLPRALSRR